MDFLRDTEAFIDMMFDRMPLELSLDGGETNRLGEAIDRLFEKIVDIVARQNGDLGILTLNVAEIIVELLNALRGGTDQQHVEWCFTVVQRILYSAGLKLELEHVDAVYVRQRFFMELLPLLPVDSHRLVIQPRIAHFLRTYYSWPASL